MDERQCGGLGLGFDGRRICRRAKIKSPFGAALDALDNLQTATMQNVSGLGRPRRDGTESRRDHPRENARVIAGPVARFDVRFAVMQQAVEARAPVTVESGIRAFSQTNKMQKPRAHRATIRQHGLQLRQRLGRLMRGQRAAAGED